MPSTKHILCSVQVHKLQAFQSFHVHLEEILSLEKALRNYREAESLELQWRCWGGDFLGSNMLPGQELINRSCIGPISIRSLQQAMLSGTGSILST